MDFVFSVQDDPLNRIDRENLEFPNRQCFRLDKVPLICQFED